MRAESNIAQSPPDVYFVTCCLQKKPYPNNEIRHFAIFKQIIIQNSTLTTKDFCIKQLKIQASML